MGPDDQREWYDTRDNRSAYRPELWPVQIPPPCSARMRIVEDRFGGRCSADSVPGARGLDLPWHARLDVVREDSSADADDS